MVFHGDVQVVGGSIRNTTKGRIPAAHLDVIVARIRNPYLQVIVKPGGASSTSQRRIVRVGVAGATGNQVALFVIEKEPASPDHVISGFVTFVDIKDDERVSRGYLEFIDIDIAIPGAVNRQVRQRSFA